MLRTKLYSLYKRNIKIVPGIRSYVLATVLVFVLGIVTTGLSWYVDHQRVESARQDELSQQAEAFEDDIKARLAIYEQILRGAAALFYSSDQVSRLEWRGFIQQYDIANTYPGLSGLGYAQYVRPGDVPAYIDTLRADGLADNVITPQGERSEYAPLTYIEPLNATSRKSVGFDILTSPDRIAPAFKARDTGKVGISNKLTLLSDQSKQNAEASFAMYVAAYNKDQPHETLEERRASLNGFVYATYRSNSFFENTIDTSLFKAYSAVRIFDGNTTSDNALFYKSQGFDEFAPDKYSKTFSMMVFDQPWTFQFAGPLETDATDVQRSNMILIGGTTISFAIAGFLFLVMLTRARAIVYSKQREAQQAKDDLLSLASHQLRTPATAVKQYLGMILEGYTGKVSQKQLPALQKAYTSNERQLDTINQILYVAKADAGRLSINRTMFDINLLIDDIVLDLGDTLDAANQSAVVDPSKKKLNVFADEASMRMVVENLISNASKYSYPDSVISIKTGLKGNEIYISITDQGVGIDEEDHAKLFKKFSRIDNDLSVQVGGSGIGLYIDKVLVELHNGRIEVDSQLGKGSTFTIYLPKISDKEAKNLTDDRWDKIHYKKS